VWNPSFLALLIRALKGWEERLIADIRVGTLSPPRPLLPSLARELRQGIKPSSGRAKELSRLLRRDGALLPSALWSQLHLISCWTDATASWSLPELNALFPDVEIQGKGLLATEGVVSIPLVGHRGAAVSVTSHFYEFLDPDQPRSDPKLVDELEVDKRYTVLLTTGGGLYRYQLDDLIQVVGTIGSVPLIEFIGKASQASDLCGEKLTELFVASVLEEARAAFDLCADFAMVAPEWGTPPCYTLFIQSDELSDERFAHLVEWVEQRLQSHYHYAYCRNLSQLGPLRGFRIKVDASRDYLRACQERGQRLGTIKPRALHPWVGWATRFRGRFIKAEAVHAGPV
jgi:hypothetical protein